MIMFHDKPHGLQPVFWTLLVIAVLALANLALSAVGLLTVFQWMKG